MASSACRRCRGASTPLGWSSRPHRLARHLRLRLAARGPVPHGAALAAAASRSPGRHRAAGRARCRRAGGRVSEQELCRQVLQGGARRGAPAVCRAACAPHAGDASWL
eukprot:scaffold82513_cov33-Phaeocystis_antarctica.AAC.2